MPYCCVPGCHNNYEKHDNDFPIFSMYTIPAKPIARRKGFVQRIGRKMHGKGKFVISKATRICSRHFVGNMKHDDPNHEAYFPTLRMPKKITQNDNSATKSRSRRLTSRRKALHTVDDTSSESDSVETNNLDNSFEWLDNEEHSPVMMGTYNIHSSSTIATNERLLSLKGVAMNQEQLSQLSPVVLPDSLSIPTNGGDEVQMNVIPCTSPLPDAMSSVRLNDHDYCVGDMTLADKSYIQLLERKVKDQAAIITEKNKELGILRKEVGEKVLTLDSIKDNADDVMFYTGFPNYPTLIGFFNYIRPKAERLRYWRGKTQISLTQTNFKPGKKRSLALLDEFFLVLVRLRLGLLLNDIAKRFGITSSYVSKIFTTWINFLSHELSELFPFPSQQTIRASLPAEFKHFPNTRIILDCTEFFIETASSMTAQSETWSDYKHHNTLKCLIGCTPNGTISFVSPLWGGRVSDKHITKESGILNWLDPGDSLMADRGFDIAGLLPEGVSLNIPAFKGGRDQLTAVEVEETMKIASVRIHVERAIGRIKRYHILDGVLPISMAPIKSQLVTVCSFLTNFLPPLLPPAGL